jgi:enamine deaminase RidA (YjgF/YER057c/UK114 family)
MDQNPEAKWAQLLSEHPPVSKPKGLYRPVVIVGKLAYTSGHLPVLPDGSVQTGRVGGDVDQKGGYAAARRAGLAILASLRAELGSLDRVRRVVKVLGLVQCSQDFHAQPAVVNGCSELLAEVFGPDAGVGARSAVGTHSLPLGAAVEIEAVFEFE